ncbi:MAG TPA: GNAT family N-acetyltransferase [Candidatus Dormibacteraeota bacterium]|nr:GNAT family N-acetyltransferase [Candidatus Dormibacteraeota bacterium]
MVRVGVAERGWATGIALATRTAYLDSDPLPGLPRPDGALDSSEGVELELRLGVRAWVARDGDGRLVGSLRVTAHAEGGWEVRRVAVVPAWRGRAVARRLLDAVEADAAARGVPRVWLDAVVERCLPPVYARLGYRAVRHWAAGDKPMSEVTMERRPAEARRPLAYPWEADAAPASEGMLLSWFVAGGAVVAVADPIAGDALATVRAQAARLPTPAPRLAGADLVPAAASDGVWACLRARAAGEEAGGALRFAGGRGDVPAHLLPRALDARLLALWRFAPGHEPEVGA